MKLKIGNQIIKKDICNKYKLIISNEHGDADGYSETVNYFSSKAKTQISFLIKILELLNDIRVFYSTRKEIEELGKLLFNDPKSEYEMMDFIEKDHSCDNQYYCRPSLKSLTWFDETGVEFEVNIINE